MSQAVEQIQRLIEKGEAVLRTYKPNPPNIIGFPTLDSSLFNAWKAQCLNFLKANLIKENEYITQFDTTVDRGYRESVMSGIEILKALSCDIQDGIVNFKNNIQIFNAEKAIINIFNRFHAVVKKLKKRFNQRNPLLIEDEYDVQDLLHALLNIHFDDIRAEDWTPQYAGKNSRIDFILKNEKIVIETKMSRKNLTEKALGDELIIDIERYQEHPYCEKLFCFVYDPEEFIQNPRGLESDLNREQPITVRVFVRP